MTLQEAYARLKEHFGSHRAAAPYLKMTEQHYNALRKGRAPVPPWREEQIITKAMSLDPCSTTPLPAGLPPEARP